MFKKIVTIVSPILAICAAIFVFGIKAYNDSFDEFQYDGYVIGTPDGKDSTRYYFTKDNKYKVNDTKEEVTFSNTDEVEVIVPNHAFVHYADGSLATFKKAVVLNVSNVKSSTIQYYNVYKGSVFTKATDGYQIKYLEQKLSFNNFLIKISETKYMLVGNNLQLKYGEEVKTIKDGYLEINYLDGNIIRIENQDLTLQNISSDLTIETDGVQVDLLNKKIMYNEETKVNLGEITIDSDDNIEIVPDDENTVIDGDIEHDVGYFDKQPITRPSVDITGMQSGVVDTSTKRPDEIVEENAKIADAEFDVKAIDVTASSVNVNVGITDKAGVLNGPLTWKVVENATNQIVCMGNQAQGQTTLSFNCNQLAPDTNYSVIIRSAYTKNEVNYEKDFVQKTFVTSTIGVTIDKDYVSTKAVSFLLKINDFSNVTKFKYQLVGPEGTTTEKKTYTIPEAVEGVDPYTAYLTFEDSEDFAIRSNSKYTLIINEVEYGNERLSETYKIYKTLTTLKTTPKIGASSVAINKQNSKFVLYLNNVTDPDNGILNYRADIYEVLADGTMSDLITKRESPASSEMTVEVDGTIISRKTNYRAKLYLTFFDNEKEYDIYLGNQDMNMNSASGPAVTFEEVSITHERIKGEITITDPNETIDLYKEIQIIQQNMSYGTSTVMEVAKVSGDTLPDKKKFTFPIDHNNLKSNDSYLYTIMAWVDYKDENKYVFAEIGQFIINTKAPTALNAAINDYTSTYEGSFQIGVKLEPSNVTQQGLTPNEILTMDTLIFRVTGQEYDPAVHDCTPENRCWIRTYTDTKYPDDPYQSSIKEIFFDQEAKLTNATFSISPAEMSYGNYRFEILGATDYTQYKNDLPINFASITFNPNASSESVINTKVFTDTPIYNKQNTITGVNDNLDGNTIVGYKIVPDINLPSTDRTDYEITYTLHNLATNQSYEVPDAFIRKMYNPSTYDGNNTIALLFADIPSDVFKYERGYPYAVSYHIVYNKTSKPEEVTSDPVVFRIQPEKQYPKLDVYLKTRLNNGAQVWKFDFNDVDGATVADNSLGTTAKYEKSGNGTWLPVTCGTDYTSNVNCLKSSTKEFATNLDNGTLTIALDLELLKSSIDPQYGIGTKTERVKYVEDMAFFSVQDYSENTTYTISKGPNDVKFIFDNYSSSILRQQVANVKLTFSNGTTSKTIYKAFDNNGYENLGSIHAQVTVDFSEIPELMGEATITPRIDFLYDKNISGFESENIDGNGFALEEVLNGDKTISKLDSNYKVFARDEFDYAKGVLKLTSLEGSTTTINFEKGKKGIFYKNESNTNVFINLKQLHNKTVTCSSDCGFTFSTVMPTLYLEQNGIIPKIGGFKFKGSMIIDASIPDLVLRTRLYSVDENQKCTNEELLVIDNKASTFEDPTAFSFDENRLNRGKIYCIKFTWYKESDGANPKEEEFYYGADYHSQQGVPARREYVATTLETPTLTNILVKYDIGYIKPGNAAYETAADNLKQHENFNRSITATFQADTIENYNGFKYKLLQSDGITEIETKDNIILEDTPIYSVDTFSLTFQIDASKTHQTLKANTKYYLEIIPYRECTVQSQEEVEEEEMDMGVCENGIEYLPSTKKPFTFYIIKPTVTISRFENTTDQEGEFSIRIVTSDRYRAAGGYSLTTPQNATYIVSVINDKGESLSLESHVASSAYTSKIYTGIDHCADSQLCTIEVKYEADTVNEGNVLQYTVTKDIAVSTEIDIGSSSVLSANVSQIKLGFADSYQITDIKTFDYTISSNETGAAVSDSDVEAIWGIDDNETYYYLTIPVSLARGRYSLTVSFKDKNGVLVTSNTYDVFIT